MTTAKLEITLPDEVWAANVTRAHPEATVRPLAHVSRDQKGFGLALVSAPNLETVLEDIRRDDSILELEVIGQTGDEATIEFTTTMPLLLLSSQASGTALEMPVRIEDGIAQVEVTGSRDRLSRLCNQLEAKGLEYDIVYIQEYRNPGETLSERQREILCAAVDLGYYDSPRRCTLTDLADEFDIAKSTCSEILQRAEGHIVKAFRENLPTAKDR